MGVGAAHLLDVVSRGVVTAAQGGDYNKVLDTVCF